MLQKVQRGSAGVYKCEAQNREGKGVSNSVKLNVMCKYTCDSSGNHSPTGLEVSLGGGRLGSSLPIALPNLFFNVKGMFVTLSNSI